MLYEVENIFTDDTDINIVKSWLCGASSGATWPILDRFLPRIEFKDWSFDEIEVDVDDIIGPCLYLKVDDPDLDSKAKRIVDRLDALIADINAEPSRFFEKAGKVEES